MSRKTVFAAHVLFAAVLASCSTAFAQTSSDACSLLTSAQVSSAVSAQVGAGAYVMPTFKATCTWTAPPGAAAKAPVAIVAAPNRMAAATAIVVLCMKISPTAALV